VSYVSLGVAFALTWFFLVNVGVSLAVAAVTPAALRSSRGWCPVSRRRFVLALRTAPACLAALYVFGGFVPAYWRFEPRHAVEPVAVGLVLGALGSAWLAWHAAARLLRSHRHTSAAIRRWMRTAEPVSLAGLAVPAYRVRERFPLVSLVGVIRPRLVVASGVLRVLTREELRAVVAHEVAHRAHRDNLWRTILAACPDVLALLPASRHLTRAWATAAEQSADDRAAAGDPDRAADLASALVKLVKLTPIVRPAPSVGSLLFEDRGIADRVARLVRPAPAPRRVPAWRLAIGCGSAAAIILLVPSIELFQAIHTLSERLLALLS
jgi:Zn-dependent protease with chaperone function